MSFAAINAAVIGTRRDSTASIGKSDSQQQPPAVPTGPSGATAQTGGFANAGASDASAPGFGGGGGLASNPNVPRPGTTINPATGLPHTAGLTRAELAAKKAEATDTLATPPIAGATDAARRASHPNPAFVASTVGPFGNVPAGFASVEPRRMSELSGREQAAKQLTGGLGAGEITPGKELPGGWGPVAPVGTSGTGPNATSSIYEDVTSTLDKVGHAAFNLMPQSMKDAISNSPTKPTDPTAPGTSPTQRRGSAAILFEKVKTEGNKLAQEFQSTVASNRRDSALKGTPGKTPGTIGAETGIFQQVREIISDLKTSGEQAVKSATGTSLTGSSVTTGSTATAVAPHVSLPSDEPAGALPGERSSGVGALPGTIAEKGVAVLPDEKKPHDQLVRENQGMLPGETAAAAVPSSANKTEGTSGGIAALSGVTAAGAGAVGAAIAEATTPGSGLKGPVNSSTTTSSGPAFTPTTTGATSTGGSTGLAPPLPQTNLGLEASHGATDLEATPGVSAPASVGSSLHDDGSATATRAANDRTTSMSSVTAIRAGKEGDRTSPSALTDSATVGSSPLAHSSITPSGSTTEESNSIKNVGTGTGAGVLAAQAGAVKDSSNDAISHGTASGSTGATAGAGTAGGVGAAGTTGTTGAIGAAESLTKTVSKTPGAEHEGVGHPSTRDSPGTSREPGSYPLVDHSITHGQHGEKIAQASENRDDAGALGGEKSDNHSSAAAAGTAAAAGATIASASHGETHGETHAEKAPSATPPKSATPPLPPAKDSASTTSGNHSTSAIADGNGSSTHVGTTGHRRTSSSASNGKKKVGFMNKLKGEIKVIGGKLQHDQEKIEQGEKLKAGGK